MNLLNTGIAEILIDVSEVVDESSSMLISSVSLAGHATILLNITPVRVLPVVHVPGEVYASRPMTDSAVFPSAGKLTGVVA